MGSKKILTFTAFAAAGLYYYGNKKVNKKIAAFDQLQVRLANIKNVNVKNQFTANLVLRLDNPTNVDLSVNGMGIAKLKKLMFYTHKGKFIGESIVDIGEIELPPGATRYTKELPVAIKLTLADTLIIALQLAQSTNLQVKAELNVLGTTRII